MRTACASSYQHESPLEPCKGSTRSIHSWASPPLTSSPRTHVAGDSLAGGTFGRRGILRHNFQTPRKKLRQLASDHSSGADRDERSRCDQEGSHAVWNWGLAKTALQPQAQNDVRDKRYRSSCMHRHGCGSSLHGAAKKASNRPRTACIQTGAKAPRSLAPQNQHNRLIGKDYRQALTKLALTKPQLFFREVK